MNLQELLNKWSIKCDVNTVLAMWNESHRHFHNLNHLNDLITQINENKKNFTEKEYDKLMLTALFHESIDFKDQQKSAQFFIDCCLEKSNKDILDIKQMILDTQSYKPTTKLSEHFCKFDLSIAERNFEQLLEWENLLFQEQISDKNYKSNRIVFLESVMNRYPQNTENLLKLIDFVKSK